MTPPRFTIRQGGWYAAEFIDDLFGPEESFRSFSPIRIRTTSPAGGGKRRFELSFHHVNYPAGVRDKIYPLETIERTAGFLLARCADHYGTRLLLIHDISLPWLRRHPAGVTPPIEREIKRWLADSATQDTLPADHPGS